MKQEAIPRALPTPGILYLVVDPIDRTGDAEEEKAIRVGSHLYLIGVREGEELLVHLRREAAAGAGIDAIQVVLIVHPAEILLHRQERLPCHGRDRKVGILEQLPEERGIRAAEPEPGLSARPFDGRVAPAPKPVA